MNATRQPEALLNPQQWADIKAVAVDGRGRGSERPLTINAYGSREDVLADKVMKRMREVDALAF